MFHPDDNDEALALFDGPPAAWIAPPRVVNQHVAAALAAAVRLANQELNQPSEAAIMRIFQTMMDRTACGENGHDITPSSLH